jgi:transcriptional regulator with XRE-family HTH domain
MKTTDLTGEAIRELRMKLGLKQKDCADIIGVGLRQWQKYESGTHNCKQIYIDIIKREATHGINS